MATTNPAQYTYQTETKTLLPESFFKQTIYYDAFMEAFNSQLLRLSLLNKANQKTNHDTYLQLIRIIEDINNSPISILFTKKGIENIVGILTQNSLVAEFLMNIHCEFLLRLNFVDPIVSKDLPNIVHNYLQQAFPTIPQSSLLPQSFNEQFEPSLIKLLDEQFLRNNFFFITVIFFQLLGAEIIDSLVNDLNTRKAS